MRLLLDTCALIWWLDEPGQLQPAAFRAIETGKNEILVSAATIWVMSIKEEQGKLLLPGNPLPMILGQGFGFLPVSAEHAWLAGQLPLHHKDRYDRLLVAQAQLESLVLITRDPILSRYGIAIHAA